jgi:hypothetical protein
MSYTKEALSTLRAVLFAGAALFLTATVAPPASAEENQSVAEQAILDQQHAQPVIECGSDELSCGDDLCCVSGMECCMPADDVPYCAEIC